MLEYMYYTGFWIMFILFEGAEIFVLYVEIRHYALLVSLCLTMSMKPFALPSNYNLQATNKCNSLQHT